MLYTRYLEPLAYAIALLLRAASAFIGLPRAYTIALLPFSLREYRESKA